MYYRKDEKLCYAEEGIIIKYTYWPDLRAYHIDRKTGNASNYFPSNSYFNIKKWRAIGRKTKLETYDSSVKELYLCAYVPKIYENSLLTRDYTDQIPKKVRRAISGYKENQWSLLTFAARTDMDKAIELIKICPALAFAVANNNLFTGKKGNRCRKMRNLLKKGVRDIAGELGFPASKSTIRQLNKIEKGNINTKVLMQLRYVINMDNKYLKKRMLHSNNITKSYIYLLRYYSEMTSPLFINEYESYDEKEQKRINFELRETEQMRDLMNENLITYKSALHLADEHIRLIYETKKIEKRIRAGLEKFPEPPLERNRYIVPVRTYSELQDQASSFNNCALGYAKKIVSGRSYIYTWECKGERAMVLIEKNSEKQWYIAQLYGPNNEKVSKEIRKIIMEWLNEGIKIPF